MGTNGLYGEQIECKYGHDVHSITGDTAKERLLRFSSVFADLTYYNVKRTNLLKGQFAIVKTLGLTDLFLVELLLEFLTVIGGKTNRFDRLYLARQWNAPGSSAVSHQQKFGDWFGRMLVPTWSDDFGKFVNGISEALAGADSMPLAEARECVVKAYRIYVAPDLLANVLDEFSITASMPFVVGVVRRMIRLPAESAIRKMAQRLYRHVPWIPLDFVSGRKLISRGWRNAREELEPIARFLAREPECGESVRNPREGR